MPTVNRSALVPYGVAEMYALVADIESYPEFLPWCAGATVHQRHGREIEASLDIVKGPIRQSFRTRNTLRPRRRIEISLVDGPFQRLDGCWRFTPYTEHACRVELELDFSFSSRIMQKLLNPLFSEIADSLVDAFCKRARQRYGRRRN